MPRFAPLAVAAFAAAAVVTLGVLFGLRVFPLQGRTLVPVAGMMIGNSMTAMVLVARRLVDELRDKRDEVEARLALGQPSGQAASPCGSRYGRRYPRRSRRPRPPAWCSCRAR